MSETLEALKVFTLQAMIEYGRPDNECEIASTVLSIALELQGITEGSDEDRVNLTFRQLHALAHKMVWSVMAFSAAAINIGNALEESGVDVKSLLDAPELDEAEVLKSVEEMLNAND